MTAVEIRHDLRGQFGPSRDQGTRPTCLAFAMSDTHGAIRTTPWSALSCEYLFFRAKQREASPADQATTISAICSALEQDGQPVEADWPYLPQLPSDVNRWKPPPGIGSVYRRPSERRQLGFREIWNAIEADRPTLIVMSFSAAFYAPDADGVVDSGEPLQPALLHAVVAVATGERSGQQLVLVRNSWGVGWGLSGYAWLSERYASPRLGPVLLL